MQASNDRYSQVTHWHAANRLREDIIESCRDGDKIDPEEVLAERYGVARNTMRKAVALLRGQGILASVHGRGTYVVAVPRRRAVALAAGDRARAYLPDDDERARRQVPPGVPVIRVTRADGSTEYYSGARTDVTGPSPGGLAGEGPESVGTG